MVQPISVSGRVDAGGSGGFQTTVAAVPSLLTTLRRAVSLQGPMPASAISRTSLAEFVGLPRCSQDIDNAQKPEVFSAGGNARHATALSAYGDVARACRRSPE